MVLRRLAEALRGQNWFMVVLEILIVVVGIFIGLQANDWNQARIDRAVEARYLERLQTDLLTDMSRLDRGEELAERRIRQVELLLDGIADPEVAAYQPSQFIEAVEKVGWAPYRRIAPNAYAELVSTGRTTLIRSESIRDALVEYYNRIEFWDGVLNQASFVRDFYMASAGVLNKDHLAAIEESVRESTEFVADKDDAVFVAEQLKLRTQAIHLLPKIYQGHNLVITIIAEHRELNEALRAAIDEHLKSGSDDL